MGLIEQEIKELRRLNSDFVAGKIDAEHVHSRIAIYSQTEKRARLMLSAFALAAKHNKNHLNRIIRSDLLGNGTAVDSRMITNDERENEKVKCPGMDFKKIERYKCLDFSGEQRFLDCQGCKVGLTTKAALLGDQ